MTLLTITDFFYKTCQQVPEYIIGILRKLFIQSFFQVNQRPRKYYVTWWISSRWNALWKKPGAVNYKTDFYKMCQEYLPSSHHYFIFQICVNQTCSMMGKHLDRGRCPSNHRNLECSDHGVSIRNIIMFENDSVIFLYIIMCTNVRICQQML